jgi:hypothetical protein
MRLVCVCSGDMINGRYEETFEEGQVEEKCAGEWAEFLGVAGGCYFLRDAWSKGD